LVADEEVGAVESTVHVVEDGDPLPLDEVHHDVLGVA
jgi:hypothetical protein